MSQAGPPLKDTREADWILFIFAGARFMSYVVDEEQAEALARTKAELQAARILKQSQAWDGGVRKPQWAECSEREVECFVRSTGGGKGRIVKSNGRFHQTVLASSQTGPNKNRGMRLGFGRVAFPESDHSACYLRVPWNIKDGDSILTSHPSMLLYFVENVWNLPRPRLLISITGGAMNFEMNAEGILTQLMATARQTNAWLVTGGSNAGIMKYVGEIEFFKSFYSKQPANTAGSHRPSTGNTIKFNTDALSYRRGTKKIWRKHSFDWNRHVGGHTTAREA